MTWQSLLTAHLANTVAREGVVVEAAFLDKQGEDYFMIYYMKAKNIDHAYEVFGQSKLDIDEYYKKIGIYTAKVEKFLRSL
jgi:hypothetical protein